MNSTSVAVKIESLSQVKSKLSFDIPWDDIKKEMDDVYKQVSKTAKIKGFRSGKVPRKILESFYKEHVENETIANIVNKYYWDALKDHEIDAITQPEINQNGIKENETFSFTAIVETEPKIDPKGYIGLKIEKDDFEITDADIDMRLEEIRKMFATLEDIKEDREVSKGDSALIDFEGSLDGEKLEEYKAENYMLEVGSSDFMPGFEDQVIGMKKGESKEINVVFPSDYHMPKIANKEVLFNITLKSIKEKKYPDLDENFIKNFERYDSLDALKSDIRNSLEEESNRRSQTILKDRMINTLLEENLFEAPPSFIEKQIYYMIADTQRRMMSGGMNSKDAMDLSMKMHDEFKNEAEKIIKSMLLLKSIAKKESITVNHQEIDERIMQIAQKNNRDFQTLKKSFDEDDSRATLEMDLFNEKVIKFLEEKADITVIKKRLYEDKEEK